MEIDNINISLKNGDGLILSKEISFLLTYIVDEVISDLPSTTITPGLFFYAAMEYKDSDLINKLSTYFNSIALENVTNQLFSFVQERSLSAIKPGRMIAPSPDLAQLMLETFSKKTEAEATSFDLLMTLLQHKDEPIYKNLSAIFLSEKINTESLQKIEKRVAQEKDDVLDEVTGKIIPTSIPKQTNLNGKMPYCVNYNTMAAEGKFDTLIGREREVMEIDRAFLKRNNNNVLLVGESGVGKSMIIKGLANMIQGGYASSALRDREMYLLNVSEMMSGTSLRGMFEERVNTLVKNLQKRTNIILVLEDVHKILTARREDDYDFPSMLSNILSNTNTKVICTTTQNGYSKYIAPRNDLNGKFQVVRVEVPTDSETFDIVMGSKVNYEEYHKIHISEENVKKCIELCKRYVTDRCLPASAFDIIDEAGSLKRSERMLNDSLQEKLTELKKLSKNGKEKDVINSLRIEITKEFKNLETINDIVDLTMEDLYRTVALHTNIPIEKISTDERESIRNIDVVLRKYVIGQDDAVNSIARAIKRSKVGLSPRNKPMGTFFLLGESGVGKTLLAKMLAREVFGDEKYLVKFDMSEYSDKTSVNKLIGASAGYIGYDKGGLLTEAVKEKKYCVLLLDEIEKAHIEVHNLCLQLFDEGCLTDSTGCKVDFRNTIIILTSNVGARKAAESNTVGFNVDEGESKKRIIEKELKNKFPPEFLNRIDEIVYFNRLSDDNLKKIIRLELDKFKDRISDAGYEFEYADDVVDFILKDIKDDGGSGARPIIRSIQNNIETLITDLILKNDYQEHVFKSMIEEGKIKIN